MEVDVPLLTPIEETEIRANRGAIYIWGEITYTDAFGKPRLTHFRYMCKENSLSDGRISPCEEGNKYT
jgi:hypothetical protein